MHFHFGKNVFFWQIFILHLDWDKNKSDNEQSSFNIKVP
jgi:hypothetical protein